MSNQTSLVHLCVATPWSFHRGASSVEALALRAAQRGISALAMTDLNGMWGAIPFQQACRAQGIRPIHGLRLRVEGIEALLYAYDARGYGALCRLSTKVQFQRAETEIEGVGRSILLQKWIAAEEQGAFAVLSRDGELLRALQKRGQTDLGVAMRPGRAGTNDLQLARSLDMPAVAAPEVVFADPEQEGRAWDWERHRLLVAIGANTTVSRIPEHPQASSNLAPRHAWLLGARELNSAYQQAPQALDHALDLAERCQYEIPTDDKRLPKFPLPQERDANEHLRLLCERGFRRRRIIKTPTYQRQLQRELQVVFNQKLADYFLIVADIARFARQSELQNCGRGSAANSLVSYLLGLTHVDPLKHNLYFERFLHAGRSDFPDVDIDFAWDERDRVVDYVYGRFGKDKVAMISTHATFAVRGAVREIAKAMGIPAAEISEVTRALPRYYERHQSVERLRQHPQVAHLQLDMEPWNDVLQQAAQLDGLPRHLGIHAGGIVIGPSALTDHLPLQYAAKQIEGKNVVITQWDMYPVEDAGLLKIDLLGNRGLAVIRDAQKAVRGNIGLRLDFAHIETKKDLHTCSLLSQGDTMGCFYIESPSMRGLLRKLRCRDFHTLVAASSIIRPGIASSGMMQAYVERHHYVQEHGEHEQSWYLHPVMRQLFAETYGVMAYQEDVLQVAEQVSGMTPADADLLRRAMTKKRALQRIEGYERQFTEGALERGMKPAFVEELWRQIESFGGYSFCKAHSASYAEISYQSAYLRAHHPAEFMAAVLSNYGGFYSTAAYLSEARRMGLNLCLPCVNQSQISFAGITRRVRVGLGEIRGLQRTTACRVLQERREHGLFESMQDFVLRVLPQPKELHALVRSGALDELPDGLSRAERMRVVALYQRYRGDFMKRKNSLYGGQSAKDFFQQLIGRVEKVPEFSRERLLWQEYESLGYLVSCHPLELCKGEIAKTDAIAACEIPKYINCEVSLIGWQVTQKPVRTKKGEPMSFLSFEDATALYETVFFPQTYKRLARWILRRGPFLLTGVPRDEHGAITVEVNHLALFDSIFSREEMRLPWQENTTDFAEDANFHTVR